MKNITNNSEAIRNMNGGVGILEAIGIIGGAAAACKMAWDAGTWLANQIKKKW